MNARRLADEAGVAAILLSALLIVPLLVRLVGLALRLPAPEVGSLAIVPPESLLIVPVLLGVTVLSVLWNAALTPGA